MHRHRLKMVCYQLECHKDQKFNHFQLILNKSLNCACLGVFADSQARQFFVAGIFFLTPPTNPDIVKAHSTPRDNKMQFDNETIKFAEALKIHDVVQMLNQKFVENYDNPPKRAILHEVLNDIKLYMVPPENRELH